MEPQKIKDNSRRLWSHQTFPEIASVSPPALALKSPSSFLEILAKFSIHLDRLHIDLLSCMSHKLAWSSSCPAPSYVDLGDFRPSRLLGFSSPGALPGSGSRASPA
ncbi:hypothetical protein MANES_04G066950v8 [Manihot esculenta]|uniref:Uncharacterized protein n=1 Tax=Manihot esculenta TaxID=3983 RepID=A0ACB7HTX6_MANES|nr:hypothetical protein MANES_04G066950v8 [Manihot esculenta]